MTDTVEPVGRTLKQSLLDFRDQMSVYASHPWPENGLGYGESEQFALRENGPTGPAPGIVLPGRGGPGTRQCINNTVEQRRTLEREMELRPRGPVHPHLEGTRYYHLSMLASYMNLIFSV